MATYKLGTLVSYIVLDRILDWTTMKANKPFIKEIIKKSSGLVDPKLWNVATPMHSIECRLSDSEKTQLETIYADKDTTWSVFKDNTPMYDIWITRVEFRYERKENDPNPWFVSIEYIELPLADFTVYISVVPTSGIAPLTVNVYADVYGGTSPYVYDWDWGDATAHGTSQIDTHQYGDSGTFNGSCTVTDDALEEVVRYFTVVVSPQGDIYRTVNIYYGSDRNSVGARPPEYSVNIQQSIAKNSVGARPPALSVNISYPVDKEARDCGLNPTINVTYDRDTEVRDIVSGVDTGGHKVDITYNMSTEVQSP